MKVSIVAQMLTKNMKIDDQFIKLVNKADFKIEKKLKYLGITNMNYILFHNNYVKTWNKIKKIS